MPFSLLKSFLRNGDYRDNRNANIFVCSNVPYSLTLGIFCFVFSHLVIPSYFVIVVHSFIARDTLYSVVSTKCERIYHYIDVSQYQVQWSQSILCIVKSIGKWVTCSISFTLLIFNVCSTFAVQMSYFVFFFTFHYCTIATQTLHPYYFYLFFVICPRVIMHKCWVKKQGRYNVGYVMRIILFPLECVKFEITEHLSIKTSVWFSMTIRYIYASITIKDTESIIFHHRIAPRIAIDMHELVHS